MTNPKTLAAIATLIGDLEAQKAALHRDEKLDRKPATGPNGLPASALKGQRRHGTLSFPSCTGHEAGARVRGITALIEAATGD